MALTRAKHLIGCTVHATDGDIGSVRTLYFDDDRWTVRYLVVDTGTWLPGRQVLISPYSVRDAMSERRPVAVSLTREQVRNSPDVNAERPVSRRQEVTYSNYYGYPYYWAGPGLWGAAALPVSPAVPRATMGSRNPTDQEVSRAQDERNSHLRDLEHVTGYHIGASDGSIGHVEDFLIDGSWAIRYLLVDTSNWIGGRQVLIAPRWVDAIDWGNSRIDVRLTRDAVANSPEYDPNQPVQRTYEDRLHAHYAQRPYWQTDGARDPDADSQQDRLARLDDCPDLEVASGDPDVRTWRVLAREGVTVGRIEHLIVDRAAMTVRFLEVAIDADGGGGEHRHALIPLEHVDLDKSAHQVWLRGIDFSRIAALPSFTGLPADPELLARTREQFAGSPMDGRWKPALLERGPAADRRS